MTSRGWGDKASSQREPPPKPSAVTACAKQRPEAHQWRQHVRSGAESTRNVEQHRNRDKQEILNQNKIESQA